MSPSVAKFGSLLDKRFGFPSSGFLSCDVNPLSMKHLSVTPEGPGGQEEPNLKLTLLQCYK